MIRTTHWQLKSHLYYIRSDGEKKAYEARFPVFFHLIMSTNANLRCFVGIEALCRATGYTNKPITEALQWLQDHGAIYNVSKDKRVGIEKRLHANKKVWQLTGKLRVEDQVIEYLYAGEEESDTRLAFEELRTEIKQNAPESVQALFDGNLHVQNPSKLDKAQQDQSELHVQDTSIYDLEAQNPDKLDQQKSNDVEIDVQSPNKSEDICVQDTSKIHVQDTREGINKNKDIKNQEDINNIRDERGDFLLDDIFADAVEQSESNHASETETIELTQQDETPYTVEELDYYKDLISLETLETHVYNPSHNVTQPRDSFRKPLKTISDWQQLVAVVEHFFSVSSTGYATKIAQQIAGKAKSGLRHDFACSPPMNAVEACAFAYWLREAEKLERLPEKAERLQERAMQFRALSNHFEHINFARYILSDLLASQDPQEQLDQNSDLFKPAPKDVQDKAYAEAEALLGFSLSGEF